jgi:GTP pyrophosphokinase
VIAFPREVDIEEYMLAHSKGLTVRERGLLHLALQVAAEQHKGQPRRSGGKYIRHPMVVAHKAREFGLPVPAQILSILHDVKENGTITLEEIRQLFEEEGERIAFMLDGISKRNGERLSEYYGRIVATASVEWIVAFTKLLDRCHNQEDRYEGTSDREIKKNLETLNEFSEMCMQSRPFIPEDFLSLYDELYAQTQAYAHDKIEELTATI